MSYFTTYGVIAIASSIASVFAAWILITMDKCIERRKGRPLSLPLSKQRVREGSRETFSSSPIYSPAQTFEGEEGITIPEICIGDECTRGEDVRQFYESYINKRERIDRHIGDTDAQLDELFRNMDVIETQIDTINEERKKSFSRLSEQMKNMKFDTSTNTSGFNEKIEEMEKQRREAAKLIDELMAFRAQR